MDYQCVSLEAKLARDVLAQKRYKYCTPLVARVSMHTYYGREYTLCIYEHCPEHFTILAACGLLLNSHAALDSLGIFRMAHDQPQGHWSDGQRGSARIGVLDLPEVEARGA